MKIGIDARNLVSKNLTGIGRYVVEMTRALVALGHQPVLFLPEPPKGLPNLPGADFRIARFRGAGPRMIWAQTALPRAAAAEAVDVFWGPAHRLPFWLPASMARVVTIHDLVWVHAPETMYWQTLTGERAFVGPALRQADAIVADSDATRQAIRARYPRLKAPVKTIYPGFAPMRPGDIGAVLERFTIDRPYLLFVGTLEPRKNLIRLLRAWAALRPVIRREGLLVIAGGQGWRLENLRSEMASLGIAEQTRLTNYISDADLASLYAGARAVVMPSLYEGFGFPILEANSLGVPVLTSDVSSMPEVAGDSALLVDPLSTADMTEKLDRLLTDDEERDRLAERARANAARFDWHQSAKLLTNLFEEAAATRRHR